MALNSRQLLSAATLVLATPVAVWGLVGQQDAAGLPAELDYAVRPWDLAAGTETLVGGCAALLALAGCALLVRATRSGTLAARWWQVLGPLLAAGVLAGAGRRVVTAGTIGANIGAGAVLLLGAPLVGALLVWSAARALWLVTHHPTDLRSGTRPGSLGPDPSA